MFFFSIFCFLASSTPYNAGSQRSKKRASENVLISFSPPLFWLVFWSILHHWFVTSTQPRNIISFFFKNENFSVFDEFFWSLFFILFISKFQTLKHHQENNFFFHNISKKLEFTFFLLAVEICSYQWKCFSMDSEIAHLFPAARKSMFNIKCHFPQLPERLTGESEIAQVIHIEKGHMLMGFAGLHSSTYLPLSFFIFLHISYIDTSIFIFQTSATFHSKRAS